MTSQPAAKYRNPSVEMIVAPAQWLIQLIAFLPVLLRPGVFAAVLISLLWFVLIRRGLPSLWRRICRGFAVLLDGTVGIVLFPEYLLTTARRRRGAAPSSAISVLGPVAEFALDTAADLYRYGLPSTPQSPDKPAKPADDAPSTTSKPSITPPRKRFPWVWCVLAIALSAGYWTTMDQLSRTEEAKLTFAEGFEYWREVEAWANVDDTRRAAPGDHVAPKITGGSYHHHYAHIALTCPDGIPCDGELTVRTTGRAIVTSRDITVPANSKSVVTVPLPILATHTLTRLHTDSTVK